LSDDYKMITKITGFFSDQILTNCPMSISYYHGLLHDRGHVLEKIRPCIFHFRCPAITYDLFQWFQ